MKKNPAIFLLALILFSAATAQAGFFDKPKSNKKDTPSASLESSATASKQLSIITHSPQGQIDSYSTIEEQGLSFEIVITFSDPVVALENLNNQKNRLKLIFDPPIQGTYKWKGTDTLAFRPKSVPDAAEIKVTVPAGVISINDKVLNESFSWTFQTKRPSFESSQPYNGSDHVSLDQQIWLYFTMPIKQENLKNYFTWKSSLLHLDVNFTAKITNDNTVILTPLSKMSIETKYNITIKKGLLSTTGSLGTKQDETVTFTTTPNLRYTGPRVFEIAPGNSVSLQFSNPVSERNIISNSTLSGYSNHFDLAQFNDSPNSYPYFNFNLPPQTEQVIELSDKIMDTYGNKLQNPVKIAIKSGDYAPYCNATSGNGYVESYMAGNIKVNHVNMDAVNISWYRISKEMIVPYENKSSDFTPEADGSENIATDPPRNVVFSTDISIKTLLGQKKGILDYTVTGSYTYRGKNEKGRYENHTAETHDYGSIQFTELGLTCKFSPFKNIIYVTKLRDSTPVPDASVEIRNQKNELLYEGHSDKNGLVETPGWYLWRMDKKDKLYVIAQKDDDYIYIVDNMRDGINPVRCISAFGLDDGNEYSYYYDDSPSTLSPFYKSTRNEYGYYNYDYNDLQRAAIIPNYNCFVFTERGLYRPGEKVQVKVMVKSFKDAGWIASDSIPVMVNIQNSRQESITNFRIFLNDFGSAAFTLPLNASVPTGFYSIKVANTNILLNGSGKFQVEEFKTANFEVIPFADKDQYIAGDIFHGSIKGWYLFGAPMGKADFKANVKLVSYEPRFKGFEQYTFGYYDHNGNGSLYNSVEGTLDAQGVATVTNAVPASMIRGPCKIILEGTVIDKDRQGISASVARVIHPAEFYIGLKPASYFSEAKKPFKIQLISIGVDNILREKDNITVKIEMEDWRNVKEVGLGGRVRWKTEYFKTNIFDKEIKTKNDKDGTTIAFTPPKGGYYLVSAEGKDARGNAVHSRTYFYAAGDDYISWGERDDDMIEMLKDKERYTPGETMQLIIKSPYPKCKALVTIEREGILDRFTMDVDSSMPTIEIPLKKEYIPNVYVSVILLKGRTYQDPVRDPEGKLGKPGFKIGYVNVPVDPGLMKLKIDINGLKQKYEPGQTVEMELETIPADGDKTKVEYTVAIVDEGVLNLIGYRTPSPFDFFYQSRPLHVSTAESRNYIIEQRNFGQKGENAGGGGGKMKSGLNYRNKFVPTAFYDPALQSDDKGKVKVTFTLPDNLTTFKVMVVANTKNGHLGSGDSEFIVSKNLLLKEALPMFVRPGDSFKAGVTVHNLTGSDGEITLQASGSNITLLGSGVTNLILKNGESKEIVFPWRADTIGQTAYFFNVTKKANSDALHADLPSINPHSTETVAMYGSTEGHENQKIIIPEKFFTNAGGIKISASSTGLTGMGGVLTWLDQYPYGCLEQQLSCVMPYLMVGKKLLFDFKISPNTEAEIDQRIKSVIGHVEQYQCRDGGYYYWTEDKHYSSPYLTAYACFGMILAKKQGYTIDEDSFNKALDYMKRQIAGPKVNTGYPYNDYCEQLMQSDICYILALADHSDGGAFNRLYKLRDKLPIFGQAMLLKTAALLSKTKERDELGSILMNNSKIESTTVHFEDPHESWLYSVHESTVRTTAAVLQAFMESGYPFPHTEKTLRWLQIGMKTGFYRTTQDNAFIFYTFSTFYEKYEKEEPDFTAEIRTASYQLMKENFKGRETRTAVNQFSLTKFKPGEILNVDIDKKGSGRLYYGLQMSYAPTEVLKAKEEGFTVRRTIIDQATGRTNRGNLIAGRKYIIDLRVSSPAERNFVVLEDQLPGGVQIVNDRFQTSSLEDKAINHGNEDYWSWYGTFTHSEYYKERMLAFADWLPAGTRVIRYVVRAVTPGSYLLPPAKVEEMYNPDVFGRTGQGKISVVGE